MNSEHYSAEVVELENIRLVGKRISTAYATAAQDCPALWENFSKEMHLCEINEGCTTTRSFGVSIMTGPDSFDYMAAIESPVNGAIEGIHELLLPKGTYLKCVCPGLDKIGEVFGFMYDGVWTRENTDFNLDFEKPCFEEYTEEYFKNGQLNIYAPLKGK